MGFLSKLTGNDSKGGMAHYGGHSLDTGSVLNAVSDAVDPTSKIQWQVNSPTVIKTPQPATEQQANQAEVEAAAFNNAVTQGLRVLSAEAKRQQDFARLVGGHRRYLGQAAQAHLQVTQSNAKLGRKLHGMREKYAELGLGLDKAADTAAQKINVLKARLRGEVR